MRIECENCNAAFTISDSLLSDKPIGAQCPYCGHVRVVSKGDFAQQAQRPRADDSSAMTMRSFSDPGMTSAANAFPQATQAGPPLDPGRFSGSATDMFPPG